MYTDRGIDGTTKEVSSVKIKQGQFQHTSSIEESCGLVDRIGWYAKISSHIHRLGRAKIGAVERVEKIHERQEGEHEAIILEIHLTVLLVGSASDFPDVSSGHGALFSSPPALDRRLPRAREPLRRQPGAHL